MDWLRFQSYLNQPGLFPKGKIYLSSRNNERLAKFYNVYQSLLEFDDLNSSNFQDVFSGKVNGVLLYDTDIFPECNKLSIEELYTRIYQVFLEKMAKLWYVIGYDWAKIKEKDLDNPAPLVKFFDEGYQAVYVSDDNNKYKGMIDLLSFRKKFPSMDCLVRKDISVEYSGDMWIDKHRIAELLVETPIREAPLLRDGVVVASGCWVTGAGMSRHDIYMNQYPRWELISDRVAIDFFRGRQTVMISSTGGDLSGFLERFGNMLDIQIYDGTNLSLYLDGKVDMLIYGEGMYLDGKSDRYYARQLFADLLMEDMRRYFEENNIVYYCCDTFRKPKNLSQRLTRHQTVPSPSLVWTGPEENYFAPADYLGDEFFKSVGGHRLDVPRLDNPTRRIFIFGPCTALGIEAPFGETIEGKLQEYCSAEGKKWQTVNCGGYNTNGCDLNSINHLSHTHLRRGDIVIHFGDSLWKSPSAFPLKRHYFTPDAFDDPEHINGKYFWDANHATHVSKEGYAVWARFLAKKLLMDDDLVNEPASREYVAPFASRYGDVNIKNSNLRSYVKDLKPYLYTANGAIVMNANPFTLGHFYLVQYALEHCEYLYIFVVEEDRSEISFSDRFSIVKLNCAKLKNVKVLPSGRYIISSLTFAEYFEKDKKKDETILPSYDIRIFGEVIAPTLGIKKRFVGAEPLDNVTFQYNEAMKDILPDYGVELVEIPRKISEEGNVINATEVRSWMKEGAWNKCKTYLSDVTLNYCREHNIIRL